MVIYTEICAIADEVKETRGLVGQLKKLVRLMKASVNRLPTRNPSQGALKEIHDSFADIKDFMSIYKGQGWFSKYLYS